MWKEKEAPLAGEQCMITTAVIDFVELGCCVELELCVVIVREQLVISVSPSIG